MLSQFLLGSLASLASLQSVRAYFILQGAPIVVERIDPIVSPGQVSPHVHNVVGVSSVLRLGELGG